MPRRNRVDPWGDLHATPERGLLTGNRGCLVDGTGTIRRHHAGALWISCVTEFRGWRQPLAAAHRWTPLFFLDDGVALAAGHRPCATCRRTAYHSYRDAVSAALSGTSGSVRRDGGEPSSQPLRASELDRLLVAERHHPGRGLNRATDRRTWTASARALPTGTVIVGGDGAPRLLADGLAWTFDFSGWRSPTNVPLGEVVVVTPPTSVAALAHGFTPVLHPSVATR